MKRELIRIQLRQDDVAILDAVRAKCLSAAILGRDLTMAPAMCNLVAVALNPVIFSTTSYKRRRK